MTTKNVQLPLLQDNLGKFMTVTLHDVTPVEMLDCQEPDSELIETIAQYWVPPILICPENRAKGENGCNLYYPIDGKRRVKAVSYLSTLGYEFQGTPVADMPIQAVLREDLLPQDEASYRLAFQANNLRSANPLTDVNAIKTTAQSLGVDVFTKEGRSAVAKALRSSPQTIARLAKGIMLESVVLEAYQRDQISRETLMAIADMRDLQARDEIGKRLTAGEELSKKDVVAYNKQAKQLELVHSAENRPTTQAPTSEGNPLLESIALLEATLKGKTLHRSDIEKALALLQLLT